MVNSYTSTWFNVFLETVPGEQTEHEAGFLACWLPVQDYRHVLDLCCGEGRTAALLCSRQYHVTGADLSPYALSKARSSGTSHFDLVQMDMCRLGFRSAAFDATICLWQSFGHFDPLTNLRVIAQMAEVLRPGGRLVLDIYNRSFFETRQGRRNFERAGVRVTETKHISGGRLWVRLDYATTFVPDEFNWQIFTLPEILDLARPLGLSPLVACTGFSDNQPVSAEQPRMQIVFQKP